MVFDQEKISQQSDRLTCANAICIRCMSCRAIGMSTAFFPSNILCAAGTRTAVVARVAIFIAGVSLLCVRRNRPIAGMLPVAPILLAMLIAIQFFLRQRLRFSALWSVQGRWHSIQPGICGPEVIWFAAEGIAA